MSVSTATSELQDFLQWTRQVCRRFTQATGWKLDFEPASDVEETLKSSGSLSAAKITTQDDPSADMNDANAFETGAVVQQGMWDEEGFWRADIHDGENTIGRLSLELPDDPQADRTFLTAQAIAEILCEVFCRAAAASRTIETHSRQVSTLVDIGISLPRQGDLVESMTQLLEGAVQMTGFRATNFFLLNPTTNVLKLRLSYQLSSMKTPYPTRELTANPPDLKALASGPTVVARGPSGTDDVWLPGEAAMALCVPVESDAGPIGTLWAYDRRLRTPSDREIDVLESIAAQIAILLERVVLLRESAVQHRLQRDLQLALESQPNNVLGGLPVDSGLDAAARCTSRYELGGDLCEVIPLDRDRIAIAVGDASGDSIPAAMVMSTVRGALRALANFEVGQVLETDLVMSRINRTLCGVTPAHQFMSLLFGVLDLSQRALTYTNAGHPAPLLFHRGHTTSLESHGMLLGIVSDAAYERSSLRLEPGDALVLFSDGISEAMNGRRKMFRSDGIVGAMYSCADQPAAVMLEAIWNELEAHTSDDVESRPDDRTLLVVKIAGDAPRG